MKKLPVILLALLLATPALANVGNVYSQQSSFDPCIIKKGNCVAYQSAVPATVNTGTAEVPLATSTRPAAELGLNGCYRITAMWTVQSSVNNKSIKIKYGGTNFFSASLTTSTSFTHQVRICNRNDASSQVGGWGSGTTSGGWGPATSAALITGTVNSATAQDIVASCQPASGGEACTLEYLLIETIWP